MYQLAYAIVWIATVYVCLGSIFAALFVMRWVGRIDPNAVGSSLGFRFAIFPGVVALWPLLLMRLVTDSAQPIERTAHRRRE